MRAIIAVFVFGLGSAAQAQDCPDFYRFVDFGVVDDAGLMYRGGPLLRAENFDEDRLLIEDETICLDVWPTLTDGRGNPMPLVSEIHYDPAAIGAPFTELTVRATTDTTAAATQSGVVYTDWRDDPASQLTQGETFLCARTDLTPHIGCQLVSPYSTEAPLNVYCHEGACRLPVLAMDERVFVSARWDIDVDYMNDPDAAGASMMEAVHAIHDFMAPLSASF